MPRRLDAGRIALFVCLALCALFFLLPLYVLVATAFKPLEEIRVASALALPGTITIEPIGRAWGSACIGAVCEGLQGNVWNSVRIAVPAVVVAVGFGAVNGYALSRWRVPGAHLLFGFLIAANFLPYQAVLVPAAITLSGLGLFGTSEGLVLVHVVYGMPTMTILFRNFFLTVPDELLKAARIDGAGFWRILVHVMMPLARPMLAVAVILQFTAVWNDYLFALVFGGRAAPVTVALNNLINAEIGEKQYNVNMAGVLLTVLPTILVYLLAGRWFMRGLAAGAIRG